jgi:hypothetical protein
MSPTKRGAAEFSIVMGITAGNVDDNKLRSFKPNLNLGLKLIGLQALLMKAFINGKAFLERPYAKPKQAECLHAKSLKQTRLILACFAT